MACRIYRTQLQDITGNSKRAVTQKIFWKLSQQASQSKQHKHIKKHSHHMSHIVYFATCLLLYKVLGEYPRYEFCRGVLIHIVKLWLLCYRFTRFLNAFLALSALCMHRHCYKPNKPSLLLVLCLHFTHNCFTNKFSTTPAWKHLLILVNYILLYFPYSPPLPCNIFDFCLFWYVYMFFIEFSFIINKMRTMRVEWGLPFFWL